MNAHVRGRALRAVITSTCALASAPSKNYFKQEARPRREDSTRGVVGAFWVHTTVGQSTCTLHATFGRWRAPPTAERTHLGKENVLMLFSCPFCSVLLFSRL